MMNHSKAIRQHEWSPAQFRMAYHFNRFTAEWRQLLVFYMAMTLAGYAQDIHAFIFYALWAALVLMYWEPYLSPPFPWTTDTPVKDNFGSILKLCRAASSLGKTEVPNASAAAAAAIDAKELELVEQWVVAIHRGLNETQLRVYKILFGAIIIPYGFLIAGVVQQATNPQYAEPRQAVYASALLLALMTVYTASTVICLWVFHCVQAQESEASRLQEVEWQPHDMMFFLCKILGETLNTVVQTLVAGSFTSFMPWQIFWLCILITSLSYTATNLLYGFDSQSVVEEDEQGSSTASPQQQQQQQRQKLKMYKDDTCSSGLDTAGPSDHLWDMSAETPAPGTNHTDTGSVAYNKQDITQPISDFKQDKHPDAAAAAEEGVCGSIQALQQSSSTSSTVQVQLKRKGTLKPPFLKYRWPKGRRGKAIIGLLLLVSVPSVVLLVLLSKGFNNGGANLYLSDPNGDCTEAACVDRYQQLLVILGCLGCLISYYAFTIGFLGAGPVTWLYQLMSKKRT